MIMSILFWLVVVIFAFKIVSNVLLPYRAIKLRKGEGISLGFALLGDAALFIAIIVISWVAGQNILPFGFESVIIGAGLIILTSYLHYFIIVLIHERIRRSSASGD